MQAARRWRVLLLTLVVACAALFAWAMPRMPRAWHPGVGGSLDIDLGASDNERRRPITRLGAVSPLAQAGARLGDRVAFDHPSDGWRFFGIDEPVGLTLTQGDMARHLQVRAVASPLLAASPVQQPASELLALATRVLALAIGALIAWRQADRRSPRSTHAWPSATHCASCSLKTTR
jgi:hypothetical protein